MTFDVRDPSPAERLIVALDVPTIDDAREMIDHLNGTVSFFKVGMQLLYSGGFDLINELTASGKQVFVDLKLLDIDNTVQKGIESLTAFNPTFVTLHAYPHAMRAAVEGKGKIDLALLAVTVLTSLDEAGLKETGYKDTRVSDLVIKSALQAKEIGVDGIVCSAVEASMIRTMVGPELILVTPGIRPASAAADDQKRIVTPADAIRNGSDYLVVGRPILKADDPKLAAQQVIEEIESAL